MPTIRTQPGARVMVGYTNARGDYESQIDILAHGLADDEGHFTFDIDPNKVQPQDATVRIRVPREETKPLEYKLEPFEKRITPMEPPDVEETEPDNRNVEPDSEGVLSEQPADECILHPGATQGDGDPITED